MSDHGVRPERRGRRRSTSASGAARAFPQRPDAAAPGPEQHHRPAWHMAPTLFWRRLPCPLPVGNVTVARGPRMTRALRRQDGKQTKRSASWRCGRHRAEKAVRFPLQTPRSPARPQHPVALRAPPRLLLRRINRVVGRHVSQRGGSDRLPRQPPAGRLRRRRGSLPGRRGGAPIAGAPADAL